MRPIQMSWMDEIMSVNAWGGFGEVIRINVGAEGDEREEVDDQMNDHGQEGLAYV